MNIDIPQLALVVLIGPSGAGKSTFARRHFKPTEVLSSDACRGLVSDDENDQGATDAAFDVLHFIAERRLAAGKLTVIDATNVRPEDRRPLVQLARSYHCLPVAVVFDIAESVCQRRNAARTDRTFGRHVIRGQRSAMRRGLRGLKREGFRHIFTLESDEQLDTACVTRQPLWNDKRELCGPFDIVGDIHGCYDELTTLLEQLGYTVQHDNDGPRVTPPDGRTLIFLGDLVDRGPRTPDVLTLVMGMVRAGTALCVPGNHDVKLLRKLRGKDVRITHGLAESLAQLESKSDDFHQAVISFIDGLVSHYVLDGGKLVVAHAGMKACMQGRGSGKVREFALYGETTGETDNFGLPVRHDWAAEYRGQARVVYGHTPVPHAEWLNRTINIDTGCVFGGSLTALRYPEQELVSVPARAVYAEPARPFTPHDAAAPLNAQQAYDDMLDIDDIIGKRMVSTRLLHTVTLEADQTAAALEVVSRFAINPKWLIYLPPTMSPCETTTTGALLEHPTEALEYYRTQGVPHVMCQQKHMGSRAIVIVCRDEQAVQQRFGIVDDGLGMIYTRTGRRFFDDQDMEQALLARAHAAVSAADLWSALDTDWVCLDSELMPWSAKAQGLLREQYAAVGSAANAALAAVTDVLCQATDRRLELGTLSESFNERRTLAAHYVDAYRQYCWPVADVSDLTLAPFHLLASAGGVHVDRDHAWHMGILGRLCQADPEILLATPCRVVDLTDARDIADAVTWWEVLTAEGGEGMVVKPLDFVVRGRRGLLQPAIKCRGREYLRVIYGPEYTRPEHLDRLRRRGLKRKRALALREFALGIEALERFHRREPLRRVHECTVGVLALESAPVDPRL